MSNQRGVAFFWDTRCISNEVPLFDWYRVCWTAVYNGLWVSQIHCLVFQCGESYPLLHTAKAIVLKTRPIPMPAEIGYSLRRGRGGSLDCVWGVQTHSGPPVILVPFRKDLARMNGTPQPNQKWLPAQGIERGSLNPKPQPLTSGRFLTPKFITCCSNKRDVTSYQSQKHSHNRLPHLAAHLEFNTLSSRVSQVQRD